MKKERTELAMMLGGLLEDDNFKRLDQRLGAPNMYSILKIEYQKFNYNALLSYLLNPHASHGLEDKFLRYFLAKALGASPLQNERKSQQLSPIPYEVVEESLLDWDQLDVLSADLRETMVTTDFPLGDEGRTVDITIWNEPYSFVVYVENMVAIKQGWSRYNKRTKRGFKSRSREYLLDLYKQWASEESGQEYQILPVFLTMGDLIPDEPYCTRLLSYEWMADALEFCLNEPNLNSRSALLVRDFIEHIQRVLPETLDRELFNQLNVVTDMYGPVICRLHDHVAECNGCDSEDDLVVAYHDIYRRHRECMDTLWIFADSRPYAILEEIEKEIHNLGFGNDIVLERTPSTLSGYSHSWNEGNQKAEKEQPPPLAEVYFSASVGACGIFVYREPLRGVLNKIWMVAQEQAEEMGLALSERKPTSRNFHLAKTKYDAYNPLDIAKDFVRYYNLLHEILKNVTP